MSGGAFNYSQYVIEDISDAIEEVIRDNGVGPVEGEDNYGRDFYNFSGKTIEKFKEAVETLKRAEIMAQRIDWLLSGDDGEESFHKKWNQELGIKEVEEEKPIRKNIFFGGSIACPECGEDNNPNFEICWYCAGRLKEEEL